MILSYDQSSSEAIFARTPCGTTTGKKKKGTNIVIKVFIVISYISF